MAVYEITANNEIEIDFQGVFPSLETRNQMKAVKMRWDPTRKLWHGFNNEAVLAVAKEICEDTAIKTSPASKKVSTRKTPVKTYALKLKIKDIINADTAQMGKWEKALKTHVNDVMGEDNSSHCGNAVSKSQESVWVNCFKFIASTLSSLQTDMQKFDLIFEYSLPGTVHERPDVLLLTNSKVISLEFKGKAAPQVNDNKDDVAQAIRYKEWIENHHKVTREKKLTVKSYLVCTHRNAKAGHLRGITILTKDNFCDVIEQELEQESVCSFCKEWLDSSRTEMPDMLQAIEIMYRDGKIPYISDVNKKCLEAVLNYIEEAKEEKKRILILINGVPGSGKTAVGQSVVYEENKNGHANAVYLSGNSPLVEVLQYQINLVGHNRHMGENAIQGIKEFKKEYFSNSQRENRKVPEQSVLVFDEAQRAWDEAKGGRGFSEPEGLFDVGERIYHERGYAVLIGLYGNGQVIYEGEEAGLELWQNALKEHSDWSVIVSDDLSEDIQGLESRKIVNNNLSLPASIRADFIDCSKWVEQAIGMNGADELAAKKELEELQKTSMRICITRDAAKVKARMEEIDIDHPEWKYGILVSNFAEQNVIRKAYPGWNIGYNGTNAVSNRKYGPWFAGGCKNLDKACSVYGNQGLELDCPIILFGGEYIRHNGRWATRGDTYNRLKSKFKDPDTIVENNFRVLLTRARKEMVIHIPDDPILDETYQYFIDMGMDLL